MDIEALAKKVAEYANTCCYRSDGFEEDVLKVARDAIVEAVAAEREACAKVCDEMAEVYGDNSAGRALGIAADKMRSNV